jgi:dTDP-4-amino-4,6-dideoxygalactose transaminase
MPPFDEYTEEIKELWETRWLTNMGKKHKQFESDLRSFLNCSFVIVLYLTLF